LICEYEEDASNSHATTKSVSSTLSSIITKTNSLERLIPLCHKHVLTSPNKEQWLDAEQKEMAGLWEVGAWIWAKFPDDIRPIMSKWTYALKTNAEGEIQRFKARICARGDQTKEGIDYEETFSPVVKWESIRLFLALKVLLKLSPLQLDVALAYLYAPLAPGMVFRFVKSLLRTTTKWAKLVSHLDSCKIC